MGNPFWSKPKFKNIKKVLDNPPVYIFIVSAIEKSIDQKRKLKGVALIVDNMIILEKVHSFSENLSLGIAL